MAPSVRLTPPLHADETPTSFVSRLAARNGTSMRTFCRDYEIAFQGVVDGNAETLNYVAALARADPETLRDAAFVKKGTRRRTYRGIDLHDSVLRRERIALCAVCALADIESYPSLRPNAAVYGRAIWLLNPLRTCPTHKVPLTLLSMDMKRMHDFAYYLAAAVPDLEQLAASNVRRDLSGLEAYTLRRLRGTASSPLLDPLPLAAAVRLCKTAGAVLLSGPKVDIKILSGEDEHAAANAGFEAISDGPDAFRSLLDRLIEAKGPRARKDSPAVTFGRLYVLLRTRTDGDPAYNTVRDIMARHAIDNFALAAGHDLFGKTVKRRVVHSVHTLAKEHAIHPKRLRKHLKAAGLLSEDQAARSDNNVLIDADRAAGLARRLSGTLPLVEARKHINAPRAQMDVLIKAGIIIARECTNGTGARKRYAVADLDDLIERMAGLGPARGQRPGSPCTIPEATKRCCCSAADVVRLILDGKIRTVKGPARGYMGILVDAIAVRKLVRGAETGARSLRDTARAIGTSDLVLDALIAAGHIAAQTGTNAVNRCPQTLVADDEIQRFEAKFASLWALSKEFGMFMATLKSELDRAGVAPAFDPTVIGARFYRRGDADKVEAAVRRKRPVPKADGRAGPRTTASRTPSRS
jgi:hypothetical protein